MLEPNTARNPSQVRIRIITLPEPVKTEYGYVRDFCRDLHSRATDDVDLFVHLGEARGWDWLTVERVAYKQGMSSVWWTENEEVKYYSVEDDAGQTIDDVGPCPWDEVPMGLRTALNVDKVTDGATTILSNLYRFRKPSASAETIPGTKDFTAPIKINPHSEGGPYLCGFINYESLANRHVRKLKRNVLFCHMPGEADEENLSRTRDGLLAILVSAANEVVLQKMTG